MSENIGFDRARQQGAPYRSNLFVARFLSLPSELTNGQDITLKVENVTTPEGDFENTERNFVHDTLRFASGKNKAQEIDVEFDMDLDQFPKNFFYNWQALVRENMTNMGAAPDVYKGYIRIVALNDTSDSDEAEEVRHYNLLGAWPQNNAGLDLAYDDKDKTTFSVTFSVDNFIESSL